jgi:hypothetical protein
VPVEPLSSEDRRRHRRGGSAARPPRCARPRPACRRNRDSPSRHRPAALHGLRDGAAEHELLAHLAHCGGNGRADDRFAEPADHGAQRAFDAAFALVQNAAGQHQRPGRGVDENGARSAGMRGPVVRRDLVADQFVDRLVVRHAQQRLGQTHQRHAFLCRQVHRPKGKPPSAADRRMRGRRARDPLHRRRSPRVLGSVRWRGKPRQGLRLVGQVVGAHLATNRVEFVRAWQSLAALRVVRNGARRKRPSSSVE